MRASKPSRPERETARRPLEETARPIRHHGVVVTAPLTRLGFEHSRRARNARRPRAGTFAARFVLTRNEHPRRRRRNDECLGRAAARFEGGRLAGAAKRSHAVRTAKSSRGQLIDCAARAARRGPLSARATRRRGVGRREDRRAQRVAGERPTRRRTRFAFRRGSLDGSPAFAIAVGDRAARTTGAGWKFPVRRASDQDAFEGRDSALAVPESDLARVAADAGGAVARQLERNAIERADGARPDGTASARRGRLLTGGTAGCGLPGLRTVEGLAGGTGGGLRARRG